VSDLIGKWSYRPLHDTNAAVVLELRGDGTYVQTITLPRGVVTSAGHWKIDGTNLRLDRVLTEFDDWRASETQSWRIVDRNESPTGFAIFGGAVDPDQWIVLQWAR
jgi:hypothetical protein